MNFKNTVIPKAKMIVQKFGTSLSGMIMPIIGIIIAWGLLTAFFIKDGWTPVHSIDKYVVGNIITWLIPILIGFLGGKQIYGMKGGFMGAAATAGIIAGAKMFEDGGVWPVKAPLGAQFLGAMVSGPLSAWVFKKIETLWEGKVKPGFEMLVNNFSMGIIGLGMILFSFFITPWGIYGLTYVLGEIVHPLAEHKLLPLTSIFVEPSKPLFLNNAINHGVFTPLGIAEATDKGKSILFYIESNPGPGLGLLIAYMLMDKNQRGSASSASVIHFFGGIHEVYFPFIIMRPILVLATIAGGATGVAILQIFDSITTGGVGAIAPASPGSVIALFAVSTHSAMAYAGLALSILSATVVSFLVATLLMKTTKKRTMSKNEAIAKMNASKGRDSKYIKAESSISVGKDIKSVIFSCDAGMGSSAMGAGILRKLFKDRGLNVKVTNVAVRELSSHNPDLVVVQEMLAERAKGENNAPQFIVKNFLDKTPYTTLVDKIASKQKAETVKPKQQDEIKETLLHKFISNDNIKINGTAKTVKDAIDNAGEMLFKNGNVKKPYINSMHKRNTDVSVYIGHGVAIPHGQSDSLKWIKESGISITTYPKGLDWNGEKVYLVIGIAGNNDVHLELLQELAIKLSDEHVVAKIAKSKTVKNIKGIL